MNALNPSRIALAVVITLFASTAHQGPVLEGCAVARDAFVRRLAERLPDARVVAPRYPPVMGACVLGRRALDWPAPQFAVEHQS